MKRWVHKSFAQVLVALVVACLTACGPRSPHTGTAPTARVAVVISTLNNPWFVALANAAKDRLEQLGYQAIIFDSQNDSAKEADSFENIVSSGYKAVLFNPTDANGSITNAQRAHDANIAVFTMDREINSDNAVVSQILSDNNAGAVAVGHEFLAQVGSDGVYVELLGILTDNNTRARSNGFHSVVDKSPGLKMIAQQSADFDRGRALEVMESILQSHSHIDAVFCGNDAMALGAYQALLAAGRADKVRIFGFDGSDDGVKAVSDGKLAATAMQYPKVIAKTAAEYADRYLRGGRDLPKRVPVAVDLVTRANASLFADYGRKESP